MINGGENIKLYSNGDSQVGWVRLLEPNTKIKQTQHRHVELCSRKIARWVLFFYSGHIWPVYISNIRTDPRDYEIQKQSVLMEC